MTNSSPVTTTPASLPPAPTHHPSPLHSLQQQLKQLRLTQMLNQWESLEQQAMQEQWSYAQFLLALCELEVNRRWNGRIQSALTVRVACA